MSNETEELSPAPESPDAAVKSSREAAGPEPFDRDRVARPKYLFFAIVAGITVIADVGSKAWAETTLSGLARGEHAIVLVKNTLNFVLAYNQGGAWGLFHGAADSFRKPFFLIVSLAAIAFIVSLYRRIQPNQWALRWGLPLVLGGALGNLTDRVTRIGVVDFIDYRADWVMSMNRLISKVAPGWTLTDHWPTFNVADIAICVGVILMALDVLFAKKKHESTEDSPSPSGAHHRPVA